MDCAQRVMFVRALRKLARDARLQRARLAADSAERQFYLGVDAAAQGLLHPQTEAARSADWLKRQSQAFREGYLTTSADVAAALSRGQVPTQLPLPDMETHESNT